MENKRFIILALSIFLVFYSCSNTNKVNPEDLKKDIIKVEKEFETAVNSKGISVAFYEFADKDAVIKRRNDTLIKGRENIRDFLQKSNSGNVTLNWTPDFVDISEDGTLAYTYGKFSFKSTGADGNINESKGVFHTVWKKQKDGTWKYVWD